MLSIKEKLVNFPKVYCVNVEDAVDRKYYMLSQFHRFGIDGRFFHVERFESIRDRVIVHHKETVIPTIVKLGFPINVSFLRLMKYWYQNTNQDYAIFCEDDISFESIENWSFTWNEFMSKIPNDWDIIQLCRIEPDILNLLVSKPHIFSQPKIYRGRWFGTSAVFRRKHVKKLIEHYFSGDEIKLFVPHPLYDEEIPENVLYFMPDAAIYNFPLLFEEDRMLESTFNLGDKNLNETRTHQQINNKIWRDFWKNNGLNFSIEKIDSVILNQ
jgi:hypothetical protein